MMLPSRLGWPLSLKTPNMGNTGLVGFLSRKPLSQMHRSTFLPIQPAAILIFSVDSGYWIDRRLTGLAGPEYDVAISLGLPFAPEDCQYGESRYTLVTLSHPSKSPE